MTFKIATLLNHLNEQLNFIDLEIDDQIKKCEQAISIILKSINELKKIVTKTNFKTEAEEIQFFKEIKPQFTSKLIFHQSILKIETKLPPTKKKKKKHYEKELVNIYEYGMNNKEFYEYYRLKGFPSGLSGANPSPKVYF